MTPATHLPSPVFEGSEKRLEVDFYLGERSGSSGLRELSRMQLETLLEKAACSIVSEKSSSAFDAYVLSESSMMVYPSKFVLKTCGTTRLLEAVPLLLELAASLGLQPRRCKYSRASYLFPELQPELYQCFTKESKFLDAYFGHLGGEGGSYILGDATEGLQWHIYVGDAEAAPVPVGSAPTYSLEICMTELCPIKASQFVRSPSFVSAKHVTIASGIASLLSRADIDDYVFEPCGYSMNGLEGAAFSTVHVTPEDGFSYASLELTGYPPSSINPSGIVAKVAEIFEPGRMTVSLSVNEDLSACKWVEHLRLPASFSSQGSVAQRFGCGGCVYHHNLVRSHKVAGGLPGSPSTVLDNIFSSNSFTGEESDRDGTAEGSSRSQSPCALSASSILDGDASLPEALAKIVKDIGARVLESGSAELVERHMASLIAARSLEDPLYVVDLGKIVRLFENWRRYLPRVTPFYAVKCFMDNAMIATLAALGAGFDCASEQEMSTVVRLGIPADRIILANACKRPKDLRSAAAFGVNLTTFDTISELQKLAAMHRNASAVLRIRADDPSARIPLGNKYGAEPETVVPLLQAAKDLGVNVVGVSFHVGGCAGNPTAFETAIELARAVFDEGERVGYEMNLLDIGGGFMSGCFEQNGGTSIPAAISRALEVHFPASCGVRIISEPGRYFAEEAATLACMIFGVREYSTPDKVRRRDYWITDGLYGSMNSVLYDKAELLGVHPLRLAEAAAAIEEDCAETEMVMSNVFGPTCDGLDMALADYDLPVLKNGDWLVFPNMGAYTLAGASDFNGMGVSDENVCYVYSLNP